MASPGRKLSFTTTHKRGQHPKAGQTASHWAILVFATVLEIDAPKSILDLASSTGCETQSSDAKTLNIITFFASLSILPFVDSTEIRSFHDFLETAVGL